MRLYLEIRRSCSLFDSPLNKAVISITVVTRIHNFVMSLNYSLHTFSKQRCVKPLLDGTVLFAETRKITTSESHFMNTQP